MQNIPTKLCGQRIADLITTRGKMIMEFHTNDQNEFDGWKVEYTIGGCGGYIKGTLT